MNCDKPKLQARLQVTNPQDFRISEKKTVNVDSSGRRRTSSFGERCQPVRAVGSRRVNSLKSGQHAYDDPGSVNLVREYNGQSIETISAELEEMDIDTKSSNVWTGLAMIRLIHCQNHDGAFALMKCKMDEGRCTDREVWEVMVVKLLKYFLITCGREELLQLALELMKRALPRDKDQWQRSMVAYDLLSAIHDLENHRGFSISKELFIKYLSKIFPNKQGNREALWFRTIQALNEMHSFLGESTSGIDELFTFYKIWPAEKNVEDKTIFWAARIDEISNAKNFNRSGLWHMHYYMVHNILLEKRDFCSSLRLVNLGWEKLAISFIRYQDCNGICFEMMNATVFFVRELCPDDSGIWGRLSKLYCLESKSKRLGSTLDGSLVLKYFQEVEKSPDRYKQQLFEVSLFELFILCSHHSSSSVAVHSVLQIMNEIPKYEGLSNVRKHEHIAELIFQGMRESVSFEKGGYAPGHKENHMKGIDAIRDCLRAVYSKTDEARSKGINLCLKELEQIAFAENCNESLDLVLETFVQFCSSASKKSDNPYIHTMLHILMGDVTLLMLGGFRGMHTWIVHQLISFSVGNWGLDAEELWREGARICIPHGLEVLEKYVQLVGGECCAEQGTRHSNVKWNKVKGNTATLMVASSLKVKPIAGSWETILSILKEEVKKDSSLSDWMALCLDVYKKTNTKATYLELGCSFLGDNMPDQAIECFREQGNINPYEYCAEQLLPSRNFQNEDLVDLLRNSKRIDIKALGYAFCRAGKSEFAIQCMKLVPEFDNKRMKVCFDFIKDAMMHNQATEVDLYLGVCGFGLSFCQSSGRKAEELIRDIIMRKLTEEQDDREKRIDKFVQSLFSLSTKEDGVNEKKEEPKSTRVGSLGSRLENPKSHDGILNPLQSVFDQIMARPENRDLSSEQGWMIVVLEEAVKAGAAASQAEYLCIIKQCLPELELLITTENMWDHLYEVLIANVHYEFVEQDALAKIFALTNAARRMEAIDYWTHLATDLYAKLVGDFSRYTDAEKNEIKKKITDYFHCLPGETDECVKECSVRIARKLAEKLNWDDPATADNLLKVVPKTEMGLLINAFIELKQDRITFLCFKATKPQRKDSDLWMMLARKKVKTKNFGFVFRCLNHGELLPNKQKLSLWKRLANALLQAGEFEQCEQCYEKIEPNETVWKNLAVQAACAGVIDVAGRALDQIESLSNLPEKGKNLLLGSICKAPNETEAHKKVTELIRAVTRKGKGRHREMYNSLLVEISG